jgi:hypothetical protein
MAQAGMCDHSVGLDVGVTYRVQSMADAKVPSVVIYDDQGQANIFGAASTDDATLADMGEGWFKSEWFVRLRSPEPQPSNNEILTLQVQAASAACPFTPYRWTRLAWPTSR